MLINPRTNNAIRYTKNEIKLRNYIINLVFSVTNFDTELDDDSNEVMKLCEFIEYDNEKHSLLFFPIIFNESKRNMIKVIKRFTNLMNKYFNNYIEPNRFLREYLTEYLISQYLILRLFKNHEQSISFLVKHIQKPIVSKVPSLKSQICEIMQNISVLGSDNGPYIISQRYDSRFDSRFLIVITTIAKIKNKIFSYETNKLYHDMICRVILKSTRRSDYSSALVI